MSLDHVERSAKIAPIQFGVPVIHEEECMHSGNTAANALIGFLAIGGGTALWIALFWRLGVVMETPESKAARMLCKGCTVSFSGACLWYVISSLGIVPGILLGALALIVYIWRTQKISIRT